MPGGGGGLGCLLGEPCKGLLQQVSLTFQSVLEAVLVHWKRNGELLVGNWARTACWQLWVLCLRGHCPSLWESELGKHSPELPTPRGVPNCAASLQLSASSQPVPVPAR